MTGRINFTSEAERQLNELDDWITKVASADIARRFVSAILERTTDEAGCRVVESQAVSHREQHHRADLYVTHAVLP